MASEPPKVLISYSHSMSGRWRSGKRPWVRSTPTGDILGELRVPTPKRVSAGGSIAP
jgi:hypothetical protein